MYRKFWLLLAVVVTLPFVVGQGCTPVPPPPPEKPEDNAFRLCRPLYTDDYIWHLIQVIQDDKGRGFSAMEERAGASEGCESGCSSAYYYWNDQVACNQICRPCGDALVELVYYTYPANKEIAGEKTAPVFDQSGQPIPGIGAAMREGRQ